MFRIYNIFSMQKSIFALFATAVLSVFASITPAGAQDPLSDILRSELDYTMDKFSGSPAAPYYIDFRVTDMHQRRVSASLGVLSGKLDAAERVFKPHIRVGSPEFDNFHTGNIRNEYRAAGKVLLPLDAENPDAVRQTIWREVERDYKSSVALLEALRAADRVSADREDKAPDWSPAHVETYYEAPLTDAQTAFDEAGMERRVKAYSAVFLSYPDILTGAASIDFVVTRKYFVSSEGASVVQNSRACRLIVSAMVRSDDGMDLPLSNSYFAFSPDGLPSDEKVLADTRLLAETLTAMATAPVVDPYTGPALLSGEAAGVFFHEIFGHRIEGQRMKSDTDGQTFKKMVGQSILPRRFSVYDDPSLSSLDGNDLYGHYMFDDQGVRGRRVDVVEGGVLSGFLMTRTPTDEFAASNGHARAAENLNPTSRQSNLVIEVDKPLSDAALRKALVREARAQKKEFGLYFKEVTGGFTQTGRYVANSFNVTPLEVYKIYVDGRPDELVRGVDLIGTPLSMFASIVEAGGETEIFTGVCGAESGSVPVTAISPSVLVSKVEVQRKAKASDTPPVLPLPDPRDTVAAGDEVIFEAMRAELDRNMAGLRMDEVGAPFRIGYIYGDIRAMVVTATLGRITASRFEPRRVNGAQVLLGDENMTSDLNYNGAYNLRPSAIETDPAQIRREFWLSTDIAYKQAAPSMAAKAALRRQTVRTPEEEALPDILPVAAIEKKVDSPAFGFDVAALEECASDLSAIFADFPALYGSQVRITLYDLTNYLVTSEGVETRQPASFACVTVSAAVRTPDGEEFSDSREIYAASDIALPSPGELSAWVRDFARGLDDWARASKIDEFYSGPVLFTDQGVFTLFDSNLLSNDGNALLAKRKPENRQGNGSVRRLERRLGKRVLDRRLSVTNHSSMRRWNDVPLMGYYEIDADGNVPPPSLAVIGNGMLRSLLGGRIPTVGNPASTGGNRFSVDMNPYIAPGTLEIGVEQGQSLAQLERELVRLASEDGLEYAYIVERIGGKVNYVWRVDVVSGERTLVRNTEITPVGINALRRLAGVSSESLVHNYLAGQVPASMIFPSAVLMEDIEIGTLETTGEKPSPIENPLLRN